MDRSDDFGLFRCCGSEERQFWLILSDFGSLPADMPGPGTDNRSPIAWLFRFGTGLPVCWAYSAFCCAIAAAASGNMALMAEGSICEFLFAPAGETGARETEFRVFSTLSLAIASLIRLDIGSAGMVSRQSSR